MKQSMKAWLKAQLGSGQSDLSQVVGGLVANPYFAAFVAQLLHEDDAFAALSASSYEHSNGFDRIELLASEEPEFGLRLHVWRGEEGFVRERIHGHPWDFASVILAGSLRWEVYGECAGGEEVEVWQYPRPDRSRIYSMSRAGMSSIKLLIRSSFSPGTVYLAGRELLHRVYTAPGVVTATLMIHGAGTYPSRVLVQTGDAIVDKEHSRKLLSENALRADLQLLRKTLRQAAL